MKGRDIMKGRHAIGIQRVNTGQQRAGQSEPASNKVKTQVPANAPIRSMQPKQQVLTDAAHTSADAQKLLTRPPAPFATSNAAAQQSTPPSPRGAKPGLGPKNIYAGKSGTTVGAKANPAGTATGYSKLPNQSAQIGGRMGFPPPVRKAGNNAFQKVKRNASFYGE